jgi:hypothetical protein
MRKFAWLAALAIGVSTLAIAGNQVAVLDGTSWKLEVDPDSMAKGKARNSSSPRCTSPMESGP